MTRPYAEVIGDPIAHSKSPLIHNFWLAKLGIDAEYRSCRVCPDELADYFTRRRGDAAWRGCNVTIPHKQTAMAELDTVSRDASSIGAANCVYVQQARLVGENSDVDGIAEAMAGLSLRDISVCLIGAGGAARAAVRFLSASDVAEILVIARDRHKAERLLDEFRIEGRVVGFAEPILALAGSELIINASPLGMVGQAEMPDAVLQELRSAGDPRRDGSSGCLVFDMVYAPLDTPLLRAAQSYGFAIADGLTMLIGQAAAAFRLFFGARAPREHDAELRALLST